MGRSYFGTETLWDFMMAFEALLRTLRTFVEDGGDEEEGSWRGMAMLAQVLRMPGRAQEKGSSVHLWK